MDATVLGSVIGFSALVVALAFAVAHYRRESARKRVIGELDRRSLYEFGRTRR
ncbi:hypothetical protein [Paraburkholderia sp.]|jgi:hypothetical protein|uniref:hypothetical protein n=1 Tax=Paraburkholderia sp. TaxID=1926495 RepID=UPI002F3FEF18